MLRLAQGDLAGARAVIRSAPTEVEPPTLAACFGFYLDLVWVLDDDQQRRARTRPQRAADHGTLLTVVMTAPHIVSARCPRS